MGTGGVGLGGPKVLLVDEALVDVVKAAANIFER